MKKSARLIWLVFCVLMFSLPAVAADKETGEEVKITGKLVSATADSAGKLAPLAIECKDGVYLVLNNAVAKKKMIKHVGKMIDITGTVKEIDGRKAIEPWIVVPSGVKARQQPSG